MFWKRLAAVLFVLLVVVWGFIAVVSERDERDRQEIRELNNEAKDLEQKKRELHKEIERTKAAINEERRKRRMPPIEWER